MRRWRPAPSHPDIAAANPAPVTIDPDVIRRRRPPAVLDPRRGGDQHRAAFVIVRLVRSHNTAGQQKGTGKRQATPDPSFEIRRVHLPTPRTRLPCRAGARSHCRCQRMRLQGGTLLPLVIGCKEMIRCKLVTQHVLWSGRRQGTLASGSSLLDRIVSLRHPVCAAVMNRDSLQAGHLRTIVCINSMKDTHRAYKY